jgi:membrane associated rhomboid family serine protease
MPAFKSRTLPSVTAPKTRLNRGSGIHQGAIRVPLPKKTFQDTIEPSVTCYTSQYLSPLNPTPWPARNVVFASGPMGRFKIFSSHTSLYQILRPFTTIQRSWPARGLIQFLRPFHLCSRRNQHESYRRARHSSYHTDTVTVFYRSAQLAFLGTFLAIYLSLHNEKRPSPLSSVLQRRPSTSTSTLESIQQHLTSVRESIQKHLTYENLTYRPSQWPPHSLAQCAPFVGHIFAHESAIHLAMNSVSFYFLTSFLFPSMGIFTTATTFLVGGVMASQLDCAAAKAYADAWSPWHNVVGSLHASPRDPNPKATLDTGRLGASAGLCAIFTVLAISHPMARGGLPLVPGSIPICVLWLAEVAWEGYNFYNNVEDGIGHGGHLGGHVAGAFLWLVALRWTPYGRWRRQVRWAEAW